MTIDTWALVAATVIGPCIAVLLAHTIKRWRRR